MGDASKRFAIGKWQYYCRKLSDRYLYNNAGTREINGYKQAIVERGALPRDTFQSIHKTVKQETLIFLRDELKRIM